MTFDMMMDADSDLSMAVTTDDVKSKKLQVLQQADKDNIDSLSKQLMGKQQELKDIKTTTIEQMWKNELTQLEEEYKKYSDERRALMNPQTATKKPTKKSK
jgi:regulator of replication initiation timing